jgi:NAD-dependent DNA ligase
VAGESAGSKREKAEKLGVTIISDQELTQLIAEHHKG